MSALAALALAVPAAFAQNANTQFLFNVPLGSQGGEVRVRGDYAYVAQGSAGISVVKIAGPGSPAAVGTIRPYGTSPNVCITDLEISGDVLHAGNLLGNNGPTPFTGLFMFDLAADPVNPPVVGDISWGVFAGSYMGASARGIDVEVAAGRTYVYIASAITSTVAVFDVTNPAQPEFKDELYSLTPQGAYYGAALDVSVSHGKCVTTLGTGGFCVHDVSDIASSHIDFQNQVIVSATSLLNHTRLTGTNTRRADFSADGKWLVTTDASPAVGCRTWNTDTIVAPNVPLAWTSQFSTGNSLVSNVHVDGRWVYVAHHLDGCRILHLSPAGALSAVGRYDTTPTLGGTGTGGVTGVCLAGEKVLLSDRTQGLFAVDFIDSLTIRKAEWKQSTKTLTVQTTSTAAPFVELEVAGYGAMTWNQSTSRYTLVLPGVQTKPSSVTVVSDIGAARSSSVQRR